MRKRSIRPRSGVLFLVPFQAVVPFTETGNAGRGVKQPTVCVCVCKTEFETSVVHLGEVQLAPETLDLCSERDMLPLELPLRITATALVAETKSLKRDD